MQINIFDPKVKKAIPYIGWLLFFILLWFNGCERDNSDLAKDYEARKQIFITQIAESNNIIDSLKIENIKLSNENDSIINNKNVVVKEKIKYVEKIKYLDIDGQQTYFTTNYKQLIDPKRFVMLDSLQSFGVITDVEKGKIALYEVGELNKVILNNKKQIGNYEIQIGEFEKIEENYNAVIEDCEKTLYEAQKQVKFRLLIGGGFGIDKNLNQGLYKVNIGFQNKKGNILRASYLQVGSQQFGVAEYDFSLFKITK